MSSPRGVQTKKAALAIPSPKLPKPLERRQRRKGRLALLLKRADRFPHIGVAPNRALQPAHVAQAVFGAVVAGVVQNKVYQAVSRTLSNGGYGLLSCGFVGAASDASCFVCKYEQSTERLVHSFRCGEGLRKFGINQGD